MPKSKLCSTLITMLLGNKVVHSRVLDWLFLIFPIWLPILFIFAENASGSYSAYFTFLFLFLIGETHFLATLFFFTNKNKNYILSKKTLFIAVPILLLALNTALFLVNIKYALILGGVMSAWHVTRQSIGVSRLFAGRNKTLERDIYFCSLFSVIIGFLRSVDKYLSDVPRIFEILVSKTENNQFQFFLVMFLCTWIARRVASLREKMTLEILAIYLVGCLLYTPYVFVDPAIAAIIGVSMHWSQYLTLVFAVSSRNGSFTIMKHKLFSLRFGVFFIAIVISIFISDFARIVEENILPLLLIPLSIQLLHYYYDSLIWKGSDPYLRENVFKNIFLQKLQ